MLHKYISCNYLVNYTLSKLLVINTSHFANSTIFLNTANTSLLPLITILLNSPCKLLEFMSRRSFSNTFYFVRVSSIC